MRVLVVSKDDSLAEYLRAQGHPAKAVYTNDIALRAAREFQAEAVVYCTNTLKLEGHNKVIQELQNAGFRVVLAAEIGDPVVQYAAALSIFDLLTFPVDPADVLHRLENPATREEAADLVWRLAERKEAGPEKRREKRRLFGLPGEKPEKKGFRLNVRLPFGKKAPKDGEPAPEQVPEARRPAPEALPERLPAPDRTPEPARLPEGKPLWKRLRGRVASSPEETAPPAPDGGMQAPPAAEIKTVLPKGDEAYRDALTDCFTRRFLLERLTLSGPYSVVFIDLDNFKSVNDILGHEAGDRVLAAFGKMLNEHLKGRDLAVRWGGDEFALILPDTSPKAAEKVVENLRRAWEKAAPDTGNLKVGFSAGIAEGRGADGLAEAISAADKAMYARKNQAKFAAAGRQAVSCPIPAVTCAPPVPKESPLLLVRQVVSGVFCAVGAMLLVSAGIWVINFSLLMMGRSSPALSKITAFVVEFWKMVWTGIFG